MQSFNLKHRIDVSDSQYKIANFKHLLVQKLDKTLENEVKFTKVKV